MATYSDNFSESYRNYRNRTFCLNYSVYALMTSEDLSFLQLILNQFNFALFVIIWFSILARAQIEIGPGSSGRRSLGKRNEFGGPARTHSFFAHPARPVAKITFHSPALPGRRKNHLSITGPARPVEKIALHLPARPVGKITGRAGYGPRVRLGPVQTSTTTFCKIQFMKS